MSLPNQCGVVSFTICIIIMEIFWSCIEDQSSTKTVVQSSIRSVQRDTWSFWTNFDFAISSLLFALRAILELTNWCFKVGDDWGHGPDGYLEDPLDGFTQIGNNYLLVISLSLTVVSIAFFNFAGVSITKVS